MSLLDQVSVPQVAAPQMPTQDFSRVKIALEKIKAAGFNIALQPGDKLLVTPRSKLSEAQVAWIGKNKADIMAYLRSLAGEMSLDALQGPFQASVESIHVLPVIPDPKPPEPVLVRCMDCLHGTVAMPGDDVAAWRLCEAGLGGYFALKKRICSGFAAKVLH